ncbi:hypothetical protein RYX36_013406 [Vicia faba]
MVSKIFSSINTTTYDFEPGDILVSDNPMREKEILRKNLDIVLLEWVRLMKDFVKMKEQLAFLEKEMVALAAKVKVLEGPLKYKVKYHREVQATLEKKRKPIPWRQSPMRII